MVKSVIIFGAKEAGVCGGECLEIEDVIIRKQQQGCAGRRGQYERVRRREATEGSKEVSYRGISSRRIDITSNRL